MSVLPKVTVYGDSAKGFNQFRQINLYRLFPDLLNVGSSSRTTLLAEASVGEKLPMFSVSPKKTLAITGPISAD